MGEIAELAQLLQEMYEMTDSHHEVKFFSDRVGVLTSGGQVVAEWYKPEDALPACRKWHETVTELTAQRRELIRRQGDG